MHGVHRPHRPAWAPMTALGVRGVSQVRTTGGRFPACALRAMSCRETGSVQLQEAHVLSIKIEAAKLGANGILLQGVGDQAAGSVGAGRYPERERGTSGVRREQSHPLRHAIGTGRWCSELRPPGGRITTKCQLPLILDRTQIAYRPRIRISRRCDAPMTQLIEQRAISADRAARIDGRTTREQGIVSIACNAVIRERAEQRIDVDLIIGAVSLQARGLRPRATGIRAECVAAVRDHDAGAIRAVVVREHRGRDLRVRARIAVQSTLPPISQFD